MRAARRRARGDGQASSLSCRLPFASGALPSPTFRTVRCGRRLGRDARSLRVKSRQRSNDGLPLIALLDQGYRRATISAPAREACASRRIIYHQFGGKETLSAAIIAERYETCLPPPEEVWRCGARNPYSVAVA